MMERVKLQHWKYITAITWGLVLSWRVYLCLRYCFRFVDDDQAVMWYATVHFAHGNFPEPAFFGQNYGTMLESLLAVPFYLLGCPLNYCMPIIALGLCIIPFLFCSIKAYHYGDYRKAVFIGILMAATGWRWDLLTSIPHNLIPGFPFVIVGTVWMTEPDSSRKKMFFGCFLSVLGFALTETCLTLIGMAWLYCLLHIKEKRKDFPLMFAGSVLGGIPYVGMKLFYAMRPGYCIFNGKVSGMVWEYFVWNLKELPKRFPEIFCMGEIGVIVIPLVLLVVFIALLKDKKYDWCGIVLVAIGGCLAMLSLDKLYHYDDNSLLFSQLRMLLFWVYLPLQLITFSSYKGMEKESKGYVFCIPAIVLFFLLTKGIDFEKTMADKNSDIYNRVSVNFMQVEDLKEQARNIVEVGRQVEADVLVSTAFARVLAYGAGALYYDEPFVFYIPDKDRRHWVREDMAICTPRRLMLYSNPGGIMEIAIIDLESESVRGYFDRVYDMENPDNVWGIREQL